MKRPTSLLLAALMGLASAANAADTTPAKPSAKTAQAAKPSARGPGTQTEDELFIGSRAKAAPANATATRTGQAKQTAKAGKPRKIGDEDPKALDMQRWTGDEDLEDLEVQRMKMQQNAR